MTGKRCNPVHPLVNASELPIDRTAHCLDDAIRETTSRQFVERHLFFRRKARSVLPDVSAGTYFRLD